MVAVGHFWPQGYGALKFKPRPGPLPEVAAPAGWTRPSNRPASSAQHGGGHGPQASSGMADRSFVGKEERPPPVGTADRGLVGGAVGGEQGGGVCFAQAAMTCSRHRGRSIMRPPADELHAPSALFGPRAPPAAPRCPRGPGITTVGTRPTRPADSVPARRPPHTHPVGTGRREPPHVLRTPRRTRPAAGVAPRPWQPPCPDRPAGPGRRRAGAVRARHRRPDRLRPCGGRLRRPRDLLVAVGYGETRLDGHAGLPSQEQRLRHDAPGQQPRTAHPGTGRAADRRERRRTKQDSGANIHGGAAVLQGTGRRGRPGRRRPGPPRRLVSRRGPRRLRRRVRARLYADAVYDILGDGIRTHVTGGERVTVAPRAVRPERGAYAETEAVAAPTAPWTIRPRLEPGVSWELLRRTRLGDPRPWSSMSRRARTRAPSAGSRTRPHRSAPLRGAVLGRAGHPDGPRTRHRLARPLGQPPPAWAWSTRVTVSDPAWFTDAMYRSSAALTRHLTDKYGIPRDRAAHRRTQRSARQRPHRPRPAPGTGPTI